MSRVCSLCGKGKLHGHKVSHSNIKTNRQYLPNVQKVQLEVDGVPTTQYVCTRCTRTLRKTEKA